MRKDKYWDNQLRNDLLKKMLRKDKYWQIEKSFLIDPQIINNAMYHDLLPWLDLLTLMGLLIKVWGKIIMAAFYVWDAPTPSLWSAS